MNRSRSAALHIFVFVDELGRDWRTFAATLSDDGTDIEEGDSRNAEDQREHRLY
jgi:hypothetical protein